MVRIQGMSRLIKSKKALDYSAAFKRQAVSGRLLTGDVVVHIQIWYASRRPDLDESLILDLLQDVAYANDRQVKEKHIYWALDPQNPRCEILVEPKSKGTPKSPFTPPGRAVSISEANRATDE